jgi:hypothetical protein
MTSRANTRTDLGRATLALLLALAGLSGAAAAEERAIGDGATEDHLAAIARVGRQGQNAAEARRACDALSSQGTDLLPRLLVGMDTSNVIVANWYRTVFDQIADRELARPKPSFPRDALEKFAADPSRQGRARRLALELIDRVEPEFGRRFLPGLLDDPEFRADAVDLALAAGEKAKSRGDSAAAAAEFRRAFEHARDGGQITAAAGKLAELGQKVDVPRQMGMVTSWMLLGPFDAPGTSGFDRVFPPEKGVDLQARYRMQDGTEHGWQPHHAEHILGDVSLIGVWGPIDEAVGYAYTELDSPREQTVELRCSADDNLTVWLNGEKVLARLMWLNGSRLDRFRTPITLRAGKNRLLVKICQGPHHRDPDVPNDWKFVLRFCDPAGAGLALEPVLEPLILKTEDPKPEKQ